MLSFSKNRQPKVRVVRVEKQDGFSVVKMKTARKNKQSGEWINSVWNFVKFRSDAHNKIDDLIDELHDTEKFEGGDSKQGVVIILDSVSFENSSYKDKEGKTVWPKSYQFTVWNWEWPEEKLVEREEEQDSTSYAEDELPFL